MSERNSAPGSENVNFRKKVSRVAAAAMLTVATAGGATAMTGCAEREPSETTTISKIAEQERVVSEKNTEFVRSNSIKEEYIVKDGDGENDILYATGWVGQPRAFGNTDIDYSLEDIKNIISNLPENAGVDFSSPEPEMKISILVRNNTE